VFLRQDEESGEIAFYMKGADVVMHNVVQYNDWMDEEVRSSCCCHTSLLLVLIANCLYCVVWGIAATLDPRYNALQYNADSIIMRLRSWISIFQGLTRAG